MDVDEEYPKTCRKRTARLQALLQQAPGLSLQDRQRLADALNQMADKARDLDEIVDRILNEEHTPREIGELLIAFELTTEQLRGHSEELDGKLHEIADYLKSPKPAEPAQNKT